MEERIMNNAGKSEICRHMKEITKEFIGKSWDSDTCSFAYELVVEAMKRSLFSNGRLSMSGFCSFELIWKDGKSIYDPFKNNGEFNNIPEHNIVNISPTYGFKKEVRKIKYKFIKPKKSIKTSNTEEE